MKLKTKGLSIIGIVYISTLIFTRSSLNYDPATSFATITILFSLLTLMLYRFCGWQDIESLEKALRDSTNTDLVQQEQEYATQELKLYINKLNEAHDKINELESEISDEVKEQVDIRVKEILANSLISKAPTSSPLPEKHVYLSEIAKYDFHSALPNRIFFNEILNKAINHAKRHNRLLAILLIEVNIVGNAEAIETSIKEIGTRFTFTLRTEDILAKLDGNEFIVLLNDIRKPKFASTVAEKLIQCCKDPIKLADSDLSFTMNVGISVFPNDGANLEELLKNVNDALFQAKQLSSNSYQFHTQAMDVEAREYIQLGSALKSAFQNNELCLYYQPKLHVKNGSITGIEALMRWEHPELGVISPAKFIPLAEENGLIMALSEWALREACQMNKHWQENGYAHLTMAVNISPIQFNHPKLCETLSDILLETQLNPKYLELEINEKTIMENVERTAEILAKLKEIGVQIAIDHFGTGYTSISYLKQFPISVIKIDQSFIKGVPHVPNDTAITTAFISLAHHLGVEVVAEGVETAEQVQFLASNNCDVIQGYFLSYPLPALKIVQQFKKLKDEVLV